MITKDLFGSYDRYNLSNGELEVSIITLGATVTSLKYKGQDRAVCYDDPDAALAGHGFLCKAVGRYANRIGGAAFTLNGKRYELPPNENGNQLHGGPNSVDKRIWDVEILEGEAIRFSITMPDGDNGYPGNLTMYVTYSLKGSALRVDFGGETDQTTVFAPTVHPYFTLGGESVLQAKMQVNASGHLEVDSELIPSGVVLPCEGKFDFAELRDGGIRGQPHGSLDGFPGHPGLHRCQASCALSRKPGHRHRAGVLPRQPESSQLPVDGSQSGRFFRKIRRIPFLLISSKELTGEGFQPLPIFMAIFLIAFP